jgi:Cu/Ag efflux pump CusA
MVILSINKNPIDAIPDLSENQVIVFTEWMGRSPQVIERQDIQPGQRTYYFQCLPF